MSREIAIIPQQAWVAGSLADVESAISVAMSTVGGVLVGLYEVPCDMCGVSTRPGSGHILFWDLPKISRVFFSRIPSVGDFLPVRWVLAEEAGGVWVRVPLPASSSTMGDDPEWLPIARLVARCVEHAFQRLMTEMTPGQNPMTTRSPRESGPGGSR